MAPHLRLTNVSERQALNHRQVRLITHQERPRWDALVCARHHLKNATMVGELLCYVAEYQGIWLALLNWSAPARHLGPRVHPGRLVKVAVGRRA